MFVRLRPNRSQYQIINYNSSGDTKDYNKCVHGFDLGKHLKILAHLLSLVIYNKHRFSRFHKIRTLYQNKK